MDVKISENKRIEYLDIAKGIGLITVVFGHLFKYQGTVSNIIFSFHMPLFFFISGYCFNPKKNDNFEKFFIKKLKSLIVPYIIFCLIGLFISFIVPSWRVSLSKYSIIEVFFNTQPETLHVGQTWFLVCLFWVEILAFWIYKYLIKNRGIICIFIVMLVLGISGYYSGRIGSQLFIYGRFPFKLDSALTALVFYFSGYFFRKVPIKFRRLENLLIGCILFLVNCYIAINYLGWVNICALIYNNPIFYYICALLGSISIFLISISIQKMYWLSYLGKHSLILFSLHSFLIALMNIGVSKILHLQIINGENMPNQWCIICGIIIIICFFPIAYIINKLQGGIKSYVKNILRDK